ncbi:MAG: phosphatidate cytidylyltransferase [Gemmatimonadetes bacterium]|nr:phosphatidate cytidylyltransferase [Gemmatimonadota bacterium]
MSGNLVKRIAFSVVAIPLALVVIWKGGWLLVAVLALLGGLGTREIYDLAHRQGIEALRWPGLIGAAAMPVAAYLTTVGNPPRPAYAMLAAIWVMSILVAAMTRGPARRPLPAVAVTTFGAVYASGLLSFVVCIRHGLFSAESPLGYTALVVFPLVLTWICDTSAMAAGSAFGGPRLAPVLSPKKTWAGAIGGTVGALAAAWCLGRYILPRLDLRGMSDGQVLGVGLMVAVAGQMGDVAESLFKREVGVKDSSSLIPGHGGVLDRLDSLYFVVPASAVLFTLYGFL